MKKPIKKAILKNTIKLVLLGVVCLGGFSCSGSSNRSETSYYYNPNWTADGKIVCFKKVLVTEGTGGGAGPVISDSDEEVVDRKYYLTVMNEDGSGEKDIKTTNGIGHLVQASPSGNYFAFVDDDDTEIKIVYVDGRDFKTLDIGESVWNFDWSNDEEKIAYVLSTGDELFVINISNLSNEFTVNNCAAGMTWKYGSNIIATSKHSDLSFVIFNNKGEIVQEINKTVAYGGSPLINPLNYNEIIYKDADINTKTYTNILRKLNLENNPNISTIIFNNPDEVKTYDPHISFNGQNIIFSTTLDGQSKGISILDLQTKEVITLKE
jgi:hypothetical protein